MSIFRLRDRRWLLLVCLSLVAVCSAGTHADDAPVAVALDDAYITHEPNSATWSIGNAGIELVIGFDASKNLVASALRNPSTGSALDIDAAPDTSLTIGGDRMLLNQSSDKLSFLSAATETTETGVRLTFTFEHRTLHTVIKRAYACYSGSPTIETWTRLDAAPRSPPVDISNLTGWQLTMPTAPVRWINGLRGDNASQPVPEGDSFAFDGGDLEEGQTDIGSNARSSETFVPLIVMDDTSEAFYGGVIWSGAWRISMLRAGDRTTISTVIPGTTTSLTPDRPVEFPHTFFGYTDHAAESVAAALRQFVLRGVRRGRMIQPLVTYNTWYPYGAEITEADVDEEMHRAASIGVELFVLDAGWWLGSGVEGKGDYTSGLGTWTPDPGRFPALLGGLADQAHSLNMKFGLWIEPERIALSTLRTPGLANEQWLATESGSYNSDGQSAQICLSDTAARKWLFTKIVNLIDAVQPDYLKWDNNFWINCDRAGHGHGPTDGNFSHVLGLYTLLDEIRLRYPDLLIENVSGGGNRLDYGMMAYTDAAWMDDNTAPSLHVRHNLEGLTLAFPPAYLLSFVISSYEESLADPDLTNIVRSRMPGVLGLTYRYTDIDDDLRLRLATEVAQYKLLRDTIAQSSALLLSSQAPVEQDGWDVVQEVADDHRNAILFAFKSDPEDGTIVVRPQALIPGATYDVRSIDNGEMGSALGADLMTDGVELIHTGAGSRAHLIILTAE